MQRQLVLTNKNYSPNQVEMVRLVPALECRRETHFRAVQSQPHLLQLGVAESKRRGYLLGSSLGRILCEKKMEDDMVKVVISILNKKWPKSELTLASSTLEKIGVIGTNGSNNFHA